MNREALDAFFAKAEDVLTDWDPGMDAMIARAPDSDDVEALPGESYYEQRLMSYYPRRFALPRLGLRPDSTGTIVDETRLFTPADPCTLWRLAVGEPDTPAPEMPDPQWTDIGWIEAMSTRPADTCEHQWVLGYDGAEPNDLCFVRACARCQQIELTLVPVIRSSWSLQDVQAYGSTPARIATQPAHPTTDPSPPQPAATGTRHAHATGEPADETHPEAQRPRSHPPAPAT